MSYLLQTSNKFVVELHAGPGQNEQGAEQGDSTQSKVTELRAR